MNIDKDVNVSHIHIWFKHYEYKLDIESMDINMHVSWIVKTKVIGHGGTWVS